jgi:hypothetical protein
MSGETNTLKETIDNPDSRLDELFRNDCMTWSGCWSSNQKQHILTRTLVISPNRLMGYVKEILQESIRSNEKCFVLHHSLGSGSYVTYNIFRKYYIIERSHGNGTCFDYEYKTHSITKYESLKLLSLCHHNDITIPGGIIDELEKQESKPAERALVSRKLKEKEDECEALFDENRILVGTIESVSEKLTKKEIECEYLYDENRKLKSDNAQLQINFKTFTNRIKELEETIKELTSSNSLNHLQVHL